MEMEEESDSRPESLVKFVNDEPIWREMIRGVGQHQDSVHERYFNAFVQCSDGHVPFHLVVLSSVSKELDAQISEHVKYYGQPTPTNPLWFITPDVKIHHMRIVISILYNGKARLYSVEEREAVEKAMEALLINPKRFHLDWVDEETESNPNSFPLVPFWEMGQQMKAEAVELPEQKVVIKKRKKWMTRWPRVLGGVKTRAGSKTKRGEVGAVEASSVEIKGEVNTEDGVQPSVKTVVLKECQIVVEKWKEVVEKKPEACKQTENLGKPLKGRKNNLIPKVKRKLRNSANPDSENTMETAASPKKKAKRAIIPPQFGRRTTKRTPVLSTSLCLNSRKGVRRPRRLPTTSAARVTSSGCKLAQKKLGRPRKTGDTQQTSSLRKTSLVTTSVCKPHKRSPGRPKRILRSSPLKEPLRASWASAARKVITDSESRSAAEITLSKQSATPKEDDKPPQHSCKRGTKRKMIDSDSAATPVHNKRIIMGSSSVFASQSATELLDRATKVVALPLLESLAIERESKTSTSPTSTHRPEGDKESDVFRALLSTLSLPSTSSEVGLMSPNAPTVSPSIKPIQFSVPKAVADEVLSNSSPKRGRPRKLRSFHPAASRADEGSCTSYTNTSGDSSAPKSVPKSVEEEVFSHPERPRKTRNFHPASSQVQTETATSSTTAWGNFSASKAVSEPVLTPELVATPPTLQKPSTMLSIEPHISSESLSTSSFAGCKTKYLFPIFPTTLTPLSTSNEAPLTSSTSPAPEKLSVATSSSSSNGPEANAFKICFKITPQMNPLAKKKITQEP